MTGTGDPSYRPDLALIHHEGFAGYPLAVAPHVLALLAPVLAHGGQVLELGCGTGLLTRELISAGHRVTATDASPAMLDIARRHAPGAVAYQRLTLPDDPLPEADAVVSTGHVLSYLPDEAAIDRALRAIARAVLPGGLFAVDICDLAWNRLRGDEPSLGRAGDTWAIVTRFSRPSPDRYVREITTFVATGDGGWRRDDETHRNVLIDTAAVPKLLAAEGVEVGVTEAFGGERRVPGLRVLTGRRPARE